MMAKKNIFHQNVLFFFNYKMIRKKHLCKCGWSGRADQVAKHMTCCKALPIIASLQETIDLLNIKISTLEDQNKTLHAKLETINDLYKSQPKNVTINNNNNINNQINTNPIINNITFYGNEEQPKALNEIRELCRRGNFVDCVPRYIEMKHFSEGKGNIRFEGKVLEVFKDNCWVEVPKDAELAQITEKNSQEVIERYSEKPIACTFKIWAGNNLKSQHSSGFQEVRQKVEDVILKNS